MIGCFKLLLSGLLASNKAIDREVLKDQLQFLKDANTGLNTSFANYVNAINVSFVVLAAIVTVVGILGGVAAYIFGQNLKEIRNR